MKKLFTLLFAVALVTAASAQSGDRYRNDSRSNSYSNYSNQYQYNRNSQWDQRRDYNRYERRRLLAERQRYEMMMRNRARYYNQTRYDRYPAYGYSQRPTFQLSIGIGGRR